MHYKLIDTMQPFYKEKTIEKQIKKMYDKKSLKFGVKWQGC